MNFDLMGECRYSPESVLTRRKAQNHIEQSFFVLAWKLAIRKSKNLIFKEVLLTIIPMNNFFYFCEPQELRKERKMNGKSAFAHVSRANGYRNVILRSNVTKCSQLSQKGPIYIKMCYF